MSIHLTPSARGEYGDDTGNGRVGREKLKSAAQLMINVMGFGACSSGAGIRKRLPSGLTSKPATAMEGKSNRGLSGPCSKRVPLFTSTAIILLSAEV
jgi:hypothetical protein